MKLFSPTYLYIKQHSITGKLYFGKTIGEPLKYLGSGTHWKAHIKKHGKEHVVTLWHQLYDNPFDLVADALSFSYSMDISKSSSWLNLMIEDGVSSGRHTEETKLKISLSNRNPSGETRRKLSLAAKGRTHSEESKLKVSFATKGNKNPMYGRSGINSPVYGKPRSESTRLKMAISQTGKIRSDESKLKHSESISNRNHWRIQYFNAGSLRHKTLQEIADHYGCNKSGLRSAVSNNRPYKGLLIELIT